MIRAIRNMNKEEGFTLVELLIVVAIIGILAAIAIPQFAAYRERAYCGSQESDLANLAIAQEAYFIDNTAYMTHAGVVLATGLPGFGNSPDVTVDTAEVPGTTTAPVYFTASAAHVQCTKGAAIWDSSNGGLQK
jgi:prepilin-type N-terminal cleavage/methylation domain-containing protein